MDDVNDSNRQEGRVDLYRATIGGNLDARGATITTKLYARSVNVAGDVWLGDGSTIHDATFWDGVIGDRIDARGSTFTGLFNAHGAEVGRSILLNDGSIFEDISLNSTRAASLDISSATVTGSLNAESLVVTGSVFLRQGSSFASVKLRHAKIGTNLELTGSSFAGKFEAQGAVVDDNFIARDEATFDDVDLSGIMVRGQISFSGSTVSGQFNLKNVDVGGSVHLSDNDTDDFQSSFANVVLRGATIGGGIDARGADFSGDFKAGSVRVGDTINFSEGASLNDLRLNSALIGGDLAMVGSTFAGYVGSEGLRVNGNIYMRNGSTFKAVTLAGSEIGGFLQLQGSRFDGQLDLTNVTTRELMFWRGPSRDGSVAAQVVAWGPDATIILRNSFANSLQARMSATPTSPDSWTIDDGTGRTVPRDLTGFRYDQLGGYTSGALYDLAQIDPDALINWVNNSRRPGMSGYRPQPYSVLEAALRNMGAQAAGNEVAYARLIHRADTRVTTGPFTAPWPWLKQVLALAYDRFLQITVGFGVYPQYAFWWFVALVLAGTVVARPCLLRCRDTPSKATWGDSFFYSLENAIPLMEPSSDFADVKHDSFWFRMFFNAQKVSGFVIATVLVGALTLGS